jgi:uncharacterized protein (TIGR02284 family)
MATNQIIEVLNDLIQLDIDAVNAYEQAIKRIDVPQVGADLEQFKADHERHIDDLSEAVRELGGEPPDRSPDLKGFLLEGFTALRSVTGTEGALKAMRTNEKATNARYDDALREELPADIEALVRQNREDERRHLEYIERALDNRVWETGLGVHPGA